jgi:hypothetical protein
VDIAIIRVAHKAVLAPLQFPVQFVERENSTATVKVAPPWEVPSSTGFTSPFSITPDSRNARASSMSNFGIRITSQDAARENALNDQLRFVGATRPQISLSYCLRNWHA